MRETLAAQPVALSEELASVQLAQEAPEGEATALGGDAERYVVTRGVAVVPVRGLLTPNSAMLERYLGWTTYFGLEETMDHLAASEDVSAVVLDVDSPGGLVTGLEAAAEAIARCAAVKPVHALVAPLAASAAYWLASQARDITVTPGSLVGSIGVALIASAPVQPDIMGMQTIPMVSSHARAKRPDVSTEEGRAELQRWLDESEVRFHAAVARGRGIAEADLPERLSVSADTAWGGGVYAPDDAVSRGLADTVETRAAFYARILAAYAPRPSARRTASFTARAAAAAALAAS
ncbi:S49 family peptidase [Pseudoroseicyclus aestuarii]|uniref:S49 family peptidase n=1 Tax=Pseudoroseicyclus aestuarii TaxID=1795041 RepID=UPI003CCC674D